MLVVITEEAFVTCAQMDWGLGFDCHVTGVAPVLRA